MLDEDIKAELATLPDRITFENHYPFSPAEPPSDENIAAWKEKFGEASPTDVLNLLSINEQKAAINLPPDLPSSIQIRDKPKWPEATAQISIESSNEILLEEMNLRNVHSCNGVGTRMFSTLLKLLATYFPATNRITINGEDVGAYSWLKLGFLPDAGNWGAIKKQDLSARRRALESQLTEEEKTKIDAILADENPKAIWDLADMDRTITATAMDKKRFYIKDGQATTIGKYMLVESNWLSGALDLKDADSKARLTSYLAKKNLEQRLGTSITSSVAHQQIAPDSSPPSLSPLPV